MKKLIKIYLTALALLLSVNSFAQTLTLQTNPDGAEVYMNGELVCQSTPGMIKAKKLAGKTLLFLIKKDGYEPKSMTLTYNKKELKSNPVVHCTLKPLKKAEKAAEKADPTIRKGESGNRVTRDNAGKTALERTIIRWFFDSEPRGARIFWRVISSVPDEVKNTNESYLTTTPYEETRSFNILGLTYENSRDVTIEIKVRKNGYEDQVKRFNVRQAIDQQEISGFFEMVKKDE